MRMIIIAVVALALLGGGGVGAYFYFTNSAEASGTEGDKDHAKTAENKEKDGHGGEMEFVELDPLILPIVDNDGVNQVVSLVVSLEVEDASAADRVKKLTPRLTDAYIQELYGVLNKHAALKGGVVQVGMIKKRLNEISDKVMGDKDTIHDVLLQVVQQRPI